MRKLYAMGPTAESRFVTVCPEHSTPPRDVNPPPAAMARNALFSCLLRPGRGVGAGFLEVKEVMPAPPPSQGDPAAVDSKSHAGVLIPPPVLAAGTLIAGLVLDALVPIGVVGALVPHSVRVPLAVAFLLLGLFILTRAGREFHRHHTPIAPSRPVARLVTTGLFAKTRNPMYEGIGIVLFGCVLGLRSDWTLVCAVAAAVVLHFGVVRREERYMLATFGTAYRDYAARVPRYGWPF